GWCCAGGSWRARARSPAIADPARPRAATSAVRARGPAGGAGEFWAARAVWQNEPPSYPGQCQPVSGHVPRAGHTLPARNRARRPCESLNRAVTILAVISSRRRPPTRKRQISMAVRIKLTRLGKIRNPQYRVVVADARTRRDGRAIESIGKYHPKEEPSLIEIDSERVQYWLSVGAQPTEPVQRLLEITGDWQKFKGLPGTEGTLKTKPAKPSKLELFNAALAAAENEPVAEAVTPKKKAKKD